MKFAKQFLIDTVNGENDIEVIKDEIYDTSRWSVNYELIFKFEEKFYQVDYSRGSTEYQDETPFENEGDYIDCVEVVPVEKTVVVYEVKK